MNPAEQTRKYLENCYRFLSIRSRSEKEVKDYLVKKNAPAEIITEIIKQLKEHKFLNDEEFARSWVSSRARLKPKGKSLLKIELKQKGISPDLIDKVLSESVDELPDELTQAIKIIEKRIEKLKGQPKQVIYQKIGGFLARRGFSFALSKKAIDSLL